MGKMGLQFGLAGSGLFCKRQFRWIFVIPGVCGDETAGAKALPPEKSARPSITFKEMDVSHLIEDVYFPAKPDWKPVTITLYDLAVKPHPVFEWLKLAYDPEAGKFYEAVGGAGRGNGRPQSFIKECGLYMMDAVGNVVESWIYEDCWPQSVNFQTLDMTSSAVVMCELTLRYARAYTQ